MIKVSVLCGFMMALLTFASCNSVEGAFTEKELSLINGAEGIDSKILLARVMELVRTEGWEICNADITIAMQRPKLAPYIIKMRECLSQVMGVSVGQVSVKATTTEKLGFVGRGEGCEVYAVVLLKKSAI